MCLHMIVKFLAREFALTNSVLVLVRRDAVFVDAIAMAVFNGLGDVGGVGGFVLMSQPSGFTVIRGAGRS